MNWISVRDQSPPCFQRILIKTTGSFPWNGQIYTARFECGEDKNKWHVDLPGKVRTEFYDSFITHWAVAKISSDDY